MARNSTYTPEMGERICEELAKGKPLTHVCGELPKSGPAHSTVLAWALSEAIAPGFPEMYARARAVGLEVLADEILTFSDACRPGQKVKRTPCASCAGTGAVEVNEMPAKCTRCNGAGFSEEVRTADMIERSRLQVDSRKWLLSKMNPSKWGDRTAMDLQVSGSLDVASVLRARRAKRLSGPNNM